MRARAHLTQTTLFTWQELRERVFRIVRSKGAPEATLDEKAVPRTHPNVLLLLTLDGVDAVAHADWGCQSAGFKSKVLAWVVASAISPRPDPAIAEGEAKRLMQQANAKQVCASTLREREMTRRKWLPSVSLAMHTIQT